MKIRISLLIILSSLFLNACQINQEENGSKEITILYSSMYEFDRDYGFIKDKFKNIDIKVIESSPQLGNGVWSEMNYIPKESANWNSEQYIKLVEEQHPDILFFPPSIYSNLLAEDMLYDLTTYSGGDEFSGINSNVVDVFTEMGVGRVYALSDSIISQVLFYNKDLFKQYEVDEPTDYMTWDQVLNLATLFSTQDSLSGLYLFSYDQVGLFLTMGKTNGLNWYDSINERILFDSSGWKNVLEDVIAYCQVESFVTIQENPTDLFLQGRLAMTLNTNYFALSLKNNSQKEINWGVVTEPVNANQPNVSPTKNFQYLNGINAETSSLDESLQVWTYINSDEAARLKNNTGGSLFTIPVRDALIRDDDNRNLEALYKLKPQYTEEYNVIDLPPQAMKAARIEMNNILQQAIDGQLTVDQTIAKLQEDVLHAIQSNK